MLYLFIGKLTPLSRGDMQPISFCRKKVRQEVASRNVPFFRHFWHIMWSQRSPSPSVQRTYLGNNVWEHVLLNFISSVNERQLLVFIVTPFKIDQTKSEIWEMKGGKFTKTLATIQARRIFRIRDIRRNVLPKFIEICMETPCWC